MLNHQDVFTYLVGALSVALAGSSGPTTCCQLWLAFSFANANNSDEPLEHKTGCFDFSYNEINEPSQVID